MTNKHLTTLFEQWPDIAALHEDVAEDFPGLERVAVLRWRSRGAVSGRYWRSIVKGATRRGITVTLEDLAEAHAPSVTPAKVAAE